MKLPIPFLQPKREVSVYYLALILTSEKASAVILEESLGKIKIISSQNQSFVENIESLSTDELVETIDKAISHAEEILPPDAQIRKTVFGVKENWVEKDTKKIKKSYLQKLKKVCDSLDLSPIGFMIVSEAISNLMQHEEGAPLSAIFVELGKKVVTLTLFRGGKIVEAIDGPIEGTYTDAVDKLLKHFTIEVLPARIILYDTHIDEDLVQQFIGYQWSKSLPFLHVPQISVLSSGFDARAVTFGAASQMGFEVLDPVGLKIKTYDHAQQQDKINHSSPAPHKPHTTPSPTSPSLPVVNFGFIIGEDVGEQTPVEEKEEDLSPIIEPEKIMGVSRVENIADEEMEEENEENTEHSTTKKISLPSIGMPKISLPSLGFKGFKFLYFVLGLLLLVGALIGGAYYFYLNKVTASVLVTVTPKAVTESQDVMFSIENSNDFSNNIIAAKSVSSTLADEMTTSATGKKDVGDKAKGTVTLYNNNTDPVSLSSGTKIKSENGLEFILDKDVLVSSASGDVFTGTKPGTTSIAVSASDIGANYNLPSGTKFSFASNKSLAGKNDSAFSGGSKKSVTVVSKDDLAKLKIDLIKELEDKAGTELEKQSQQDEVILPIILSTNVEKVKYDKNAGDEAKTVKLNAGISFTGLSYKKMDVKDFAKEILQKKYSQDMTFDENSLDISVKEPKEKNSKEITGTLAINALLMPKIDNKDIAKQLSGKSQKEAESILSRIPQLERSEIIFRPNISFISKFLPRLPNHVTITVSSN